MTPKFTTFVSTKEQVLAAIENGATHLIIEDPEIAIRSLCNERIKNPIKELSDLAREKDPKINLSVNCDILVHHTHIERIKTKINVMQDNNITILRIQDPGLITLVKEIAPQLQIHYVQETGNNNTKSLEFYSKICEQQTFSNDCPIGTIKETLQICDGKFECQIQGPLLIQYSRRQFMKGHKDLKSTTIDAQDEQLPGLNFRFHDNEHGHFMYLYIDRCLMTQIEKVKELGLNSWLIDARGESIEYMKTALQAYRNVFKNTESKESYLKEIKKVAQRPQKTGLFMANKTDQEISNPHLNEEKENQLGTIIDTVKGVNITIETIIPLQLGDQLLITTPEGTKIKYDIKAIN